MSQSHLKIRKGLTFVSQPAAPSDPIEGDIYHDSVLGYARIYQHGSWVPLSGGAGVVLATLIDETLTSLPLTAPTVIDDVTIITGHRVLFINLSSDNNRLYEAEVIGGTITWTEQNVFTEGSVDPIKGNIIRVQNGTVNELISFIFDGTNWVTEADHNTIGEAEDSDYSDGLFPDFTNKTRIGVSVDRFNEVLKELCPQPAPTLTHESITQSGGEAKLSFGVSNTIPSYSNVTTAGGGSALDINELFPNSGQRKGVFRSLVKSGTLADNVPAGSGSPTPSYPANAFGDGDQGTLQLIINGVVAHSVDLSTFGSGNSLNVNGSGFNLGAATAISFPNGNPLNLFKYRIGTWTVAIADQRLGHNYIRLNHYFNSTNHYTNYYEWVNDDENTAMAAVSGLLNTLNMTGLKYISGVKYYTAGTAKYGVTISNAYRNVYKNGNAITYTGTNGSIPSESIPNMADELDNIVLSNKTFSIIVTRLLNESISASVNCQHPLKTALSNGGLSSISNILMDNMNTASTAIREYFDSENIRLQSIGNALVNSYDAQADLATGAWDSSVSITTVGTNGYLDGLLYYAGYVCYPTKGANSGNFAGITNGPAGNVDYSLEANTRYAYIKFQNNSGSSKSNFRLILQGSSTSFVDILTGPSSNNVTMEMKFPAGSISTKTGWMDCYKDFATGQWNDGDGCRNATDGAGRAINTNWGITIGTKSIAVNEYIIIRIAASSSWIGNINDIQLTWL